MVSVSEVGEEGLQESQGRDDAAQTASARRGSGKAPQPRLGRMGKVLQVRVSVAAVRESEHLRAVSPVQVPQQEEQRRSRLKYAETYYGELQKLGLIALTRRRYR